MSAFVKNVQNTASRYSLWKRGSTIIIGVSGGPDSICLLDILVQLKNKYDWKLRIAHVNYGLREQESAHEELLVRSLARQYKIPINVLHPRTPKNTSNLEACLRDIRYQFFETLRKRYAFEKIAVAHTQDDQAETVLMRLIRGSGLTGLRAMRPKNRNVIRPFLFTTRQQIMAYIKQKGLRYSLDSSNQDRRFLRNKIRHDLIPYLERDFNPSLKKTLAKIVSIIADDYDALLSFIESKPIPYRFSRHTLRFSAQDLLTLHPSLQKLILRHFFELIQKNTLSIEADHIEEVLKIVKSSKNKIKTVTFGKLKIIRRGDIVTVTLA